MAATSVLKLVLDDKEYEASIKAAKQGMQALQDALEKAGGSFTSVHKDVLEYVKGIGQMETQSRTVRGGIRELSSAFEELSVQYRHMTDEERQSPLGQALAQSLDQLKTRIHDGKRELEDINWELNNTGNSGKETGGIMKQLADRFTINLDAVKLFKIGLQAAKGALDVAKDAFFASEANIDEWGRTVEAAKSVYSGFLTALNTSDVSGFLSRMDEIVVAARNAYDQLDKLNTMKTIQAPQISAEQTEVERLRAMLRTGRGIEAVSGAGKVTDRLLGIKNGEKLSDDIIRVIKERLQMGMDAVIDLTKNEVRQADKAISGVYNQMSKELGMSYAEFRKGTSSWNEFQKRIQGAQDYNQWERRRSYVIQATASGVSLSPEEKAMLNARNPFAQFKGWDVFKDDSDKYKELVQLIIQRDQQASSVYSMQGQAYRSINTAENRIGGGGGVGSAGTTTSTIKPVVDITQSMTELDVLKDQLKTVEASMAGWGRGTEEWKLMNEEAESLRKQIDEMNGELELTIGISGTSKENIQRYIQQLQDELSSIDISIDGNALKYSNLYKNIIDAQTLGNLMEKALQQGIDIAAMGIDAEAIFDKITSGAGIENADWQGLANKINEELKKHGVSLSIDTDTGDVSIGKPDEKESQDALSTFSDNYSKVVGGVNSIVSGIQQMGVEIPNGIQNVLGVLSGISSVMTGITAILTLIELDTKTTAAASVADAAIPFARGGVVGKAGVFAGGGVVEKSVRFADGGVVDKSIRFADGGVVPHAAFGLKVPGNNFSGDQVPALLNSGELVLNRFQQQALAANLQGVGGVGGYVPSHISGEQIWLVMNRYTKRTGKGEVVTWK